jgi:hypothetical protein
MSGMVSRPENRTQNLTFMLAQITRASIKFLDKLAELTLPSDPKPPRQRLGQRGEEDAYFYLRKLGYVMVARNYRSPHRRGEIDLIGWDKDGH